MIERCSSPALSRLSGALLVQLSAVMADRLGLAFPNSRLADLERGVVSASSDLGFADPGECLRRLTSSPITRKQIEVLASHLTVGETYFFRDRQILEALRTHMLPELTGARGSGERRIRIWSAGCATGEEPYSVAILIDTLIHGLPDWIVTILATDVNPFFLEKAQAGVYSAWSFRDTPQWVKEQYFKKTRKGFAVLQRIREMVTFEYHNLAEDPYPSLLNGTNAMDIIFCRNVLMYFSPTRARDVVDNFHRSLVDGGWLVVSPVETSRVLFSQFETVNAAGVTLYRKSPGPALYVPVPLPERFVPAPELAEPARDIPATPHTQRIEPPLPAVRSNIAEEAKEQDAYEKALALYKQGLYTEAVDIMLLREEKAGGRPGVQAMALLARSLANQGRLADALQWCEKAISADKLNPGLYYLAATVLQEQGLLERTAALLKQAIYLDRKFVLAHFALGILAQRQGKPKESEKHLENARTLLRSYGHDDVLPESDGMIAGRLVEIIQRLKIVD